MRNLLIIILIIGLSVKPNTAISQLITIIQFDKKVMYHTKAYNKRIVSSSPEILSKKENVGYSQIADAHNEIDQYIQFYLKRSKIVSLPLKGKILITSRFGERIHSVLKKETPHAGIDLRADYEMVNTIAMGIVAEEGYNAIAGNYLIIQHGNGLKSLYCHLSKFLHKTEELVFAGEGIAISGSSGEVTGPHLHFAINENGKFIDPLPLLKAISRYNKNY